MRIIAGLVLTSLICAAGCSRDAAEVGLTNASTGRVFGGPSQDALFVPYQGAWKLEESRFDPPLEGVTISGGPDISIIGHIVRFVPGTRELRLCQARLDVDGIECEAWHHEDIHDPGDMQRATCRLRLNGDKLWLHWRFVDDTGNFTDDPIVASPEYLRPEWTFDANDLPWEIATYSRKDTK